MLSRLYQLQTENQQMQERITNLAAQREFLLATNSQLGSIISESQQHQQHTTNGLSEPSYNMSVEMADTVTAASLPTPPLSSNMTPSTTHTSNPIIMTNSDTQHTSHNSVLMQASSHSSVDTPGMLPLITSSTSITTTVATTVSNELIRSANFKPKESPVEKKKQRNIKHSKQSSKVHQHAKTNPAAMPGSVSVLGPPLFSTIKPSEGASLPHNSSVLIGSFVPLEPTTVTSDFMINPQVTIPPSHAGQLLPPFSEIAMELNGKTVTLSRDITAVTSAIGGPIPAMSPVVSGHNVVR